MTVISLDLHHTYAADLEKERHQIMHTNSLVPFYPLFCPLFEITETLSQKEQKSVLSNLKSFYETNKNPAILSPFDFSLSVDGAHQYLVRNLTLPEPQNVKNISTAVQTAKNWNTFLTNAGFPPYQIIETRTGFISCPMIFGYLGLPENFTKENSSTKKLSTESFQAILKSYAQEISMRVFRLVVLDIQKPADSHHNINWTETAGIWVKTH